MWAVVVAGGSGSRFGAPKQFASVAGRPLVAWALDAAASCAAGVVLVVPPGDAPGVAGDGAVVEAGGLQADAVVPGGATRAASVRAGLAAVPADVEIVVVHDAARPLATPSLFRTVVDALVADPGLAAAIPGVPVTDTLKRLDGALVAATVPRDGLVAVQTPQAFRAAVLRRAHAAGGEATDDAALVERVGGTVRVVEGEQANVKVTVERDLALVEMLLSDGEHRTPVTTGAQASDSRGLSGPGTEVGG